MAADWTAFGVADALKAAVATRVAAFDPPDIRVVSYLPSPDEQMPDAIVIGYLAVDAEEPVRIAMGPQPPRFDEVVDLISRVQVTRPGAGQKVADDVRIRARALLAEVDAEVRSNLPGQGDQSWAGKVIEREMAVIATIRDGVGSMLCAIDFNIQYKARTS